MISETGQMVAGVSSYAPPMPVPPEDPLAAPSPVKRLAAKAAQTDMGMRCAAWYLKHVVPRVEPAISHWSHGRLTCLPITPIVFLHTQGARTGEPRVIPLTYFTDGDDVILIASNYGLARHPAWYHNVKSHPEVTLRARGAEGQYVVREAVDRERERLWALATQWTPPLAKYQTMAGRRLIPIMRCVPAS
jgi:deazaflavin-dependent oxidoreductase (nitroreductase family)